MNVMGRIRSSKLVNSKYVKKVKDKIYFKYIDPKLQGKTDEYRTEIMNIVADIFKEDPWMLHCGGFLRFYRDNTMKGQDLDLFVQADVLNEKLPKLVEKGFRIKQYFLDPDGKPTEYRLMYKGVEVDFMHVYHDQDGYYHDFTLEDNTIKDKSPEVTRKVEGNRLIQTGKDMIAYRRNLPDFEVADYEHEGFKFKGPKNCEQHIMALYGENWKVYDPNYNPRCEPKNNMPILARGAVSIVYNTPVTKIETK